MHAQTPSNQVTITEDVAFKNFQAMLLSWRGSERQRPSILQQALRFEAIMQEKRNLPEFQHLSAEECLVRLMDAFNQHPGIVGQRRWQLSREGKIAVTNLVLGTTPATRDIIKSHLNYNKWESSGALHCC